jgi:hypothetical protein
MLADQWREGSGATTHCEGHGPAIKLRGNLGMHRGSTAQMHIVSSESPVCRGVLPENVSRLVEGWVRHCDTL